VKQSIYSSRETQYQRPEAVRMQILIVSARSGNAIPAEMKFVSRRGYVAGETQ
jgi:hypothetical protein